MTQDEMKKAVAEAALQYVVPGEIIGVGTGSTANFFIDALASIKGQIKGAVASSEATAERLRGHGIEVMDLNSVNSMSIYVDGADESNNQLHLIKGGGGALTQSYVAREIIKQIGGQPILREGFTTDNGNIILDIKNLQITEPAKTEQILNNIVGVVTNGLFALRPADTLLLGTPNGVRTVNPA